MRKKKRSIFKNLLAFVLTLCIILEPMSLAVHAAGYNSGSGVTFTTANSQKVESGGKATDYAVNDIADTMLNELENNPGYEQQLIDTYGPEVAGAAVDAVKDGNIDGLKNTLNDTIADKVIEDRANREVKEREKSTRVYGISLYHGVVDGCKYGMTEEEVAAVVAYAMTHGAVEHHIGYIRFGGQNGDTDKWKLSRDVWSKIKAANGREARAFIDLASLVLPSDIVEEYHQKLRDFKAAGSGPLPVIIGYLAFADGDGEPIDLKGMGLEGRSVLNSEGEVAALGVAIEEAIGTTMGTTMLTGQGIAKGSSATTLDMTPFGKKYFAGGFAIPLDYDPGEDVTATFYVEASPHNAYNNWEVNSKVTGTYRLKMNIPDKELDKFGDEKGMATVTIKHDFTSKTHTKSADLTATGATAQLVNIDYWTNIKSRLNIELDIQGGISGTSTIKVPVEHLAYLGQNGIEYAVPITGSNAKKEQHRPASFEVTIDETSLEPAPSGTVKGFENHNPIGSNYTSWHDKSDPPNGNFYIQAYDKHSGNAVVEGKVVANTAESGQESWNADVAIPSTENVSVRTGASAGMMDAYGFVMAYPGTMATPDHGGPRPGFDNENDKGTEMPSPAATRTIELVGQVVNCWGENNPVCQLKASSKTVKSGGISRGRNDSVRSESVPFTCHCCSGSYISQYHTSPGYECTNHNGKTGWKSYTECPHLGFHNECSDFHDEDGNVTGHGGNSHGDGTAPGNSHDCTFSVTIHDAIGEQYVGQRLSWATGPNVSKSYVTGRTLVNGGTYFDGFLTVSNSDQSGINIYCTKFKVTVSQHAQFYMIEYSFESENRDSGSSGCSAFNDNAKGNNDWPAGTKVSGTWPENGIMCTDYVHGTGTGGDHYENMHHQGTHKYVMKYVESINTYAYRTIESASIYSLQNISIGSLNSISRAGGTDAAGTPWDATTELAPISEGIGDSVSSPAAVGYLWKTTGDGNGKYQNGNGRILWQAWNAPSASVAEGNVTAGPTQEDYFLGDVTVNINIVQDHEFAKAVKDNYNAVKYDPYQVSGTSKSRGHDNKRYHEWIHKSLSKHIANSPYHEYEQIGTGDSTALNYNYKARDNSGGIHNTIVPKEIAAAMNYWIGLNNGRADEENPGQLAFRANIISDTMAYGVMSDPNIFLDDAYAVDDKDSEDIHDQQAGVALFSMLANHNGSGVTGPDVIPDLLEDKLGHPGSTTLMEVTLYRNHYNDPDNGGNDPKDLLINMYEGKLAAEGVLGDGDSLALFGGIDKRKSEGTEPESEDTEPTKPSTAFFAATEFPKKFGKGCISAANGGVKSNTYSQLLDVGANHSSPASGVVEVKVTAEGSGIGNSSFAGYWRDFSYLSKVSKTNTTWLNGESQTSITSTEDGETCIREYGTLAISNLSLTDWTPNDTWPTGSVKAAYNHNVVATAPAPLASGANVEYDIEDYEPDTATHDKHNYIVANGATDTMNEITIFNPVSVENDHVIGAQIGAFESTITDDRDHDQRIDEYGKFLTDDENYVRDTFPYVVQSQYLWTWLSPFGNFKDVDVGGSTSTNTSTWALKNGGDIQRGGENPHKKYVDNMNILKWIGGASIQYPFVAGTKSMAWYDVGWRVPISDMDHAHTGSGGILAGNSDSSKLSDYYGDKYKWGNAFGVTNTSNITESNNKDNSRPKTNVIIEAYTINPFIKVDNHNAKIGYIFAENSNETTRTANAAYKYDPVDLVGSIGNVTVHDVEDFRFSNYFKEAIPNKWLIDGVIEEVNVNKPLRVVSSEKDICFNDVRYFIEGGEHYKLDHDTGTRTKVDEGYTASGHSTLATTMFTLDGEYGGMAGYYDPLPLVPRYNTVNEFKSEAVRLGYKAFMSVDTIGQYESFIDTDNIKVPSGPDTPDTREKFLTVKSEYYLYDLDDGKFYDIDIWSGSTGGKERVYNGTSKVTEQFTHSGSIYQNVVEDATRRNIGLLETMKTSGFANGANKEPGEYTFVNAVNHYIGRPGHLRLDTRDLSYIGSSNNDSEGRYWGKTLGYPSEWSQNAQRYHFKDGLTSTTVITKPLGKDRSAITQGMIETSSHEVKEEHPNAVVIQFMDFIAKGSVWDIRHNGSAVNSPTFTIYDINGDDPDDPSDDNKYIPKDMDIDNVKRHNKVQYQGVRTFNPVTGAWSGNIDPNLTPVVVFQAYNTSADDRTISGTH